MFDNAQRAEFFLGASSPQGFASRFSELSNIKDDWHLYILKGGPGSGKSGFIHTAADALEDYDQHIEYVRCASDPISFDAAIFHDLKIAVVDGTRPHVIEPSYLGAYESVISLWDHLDYDLLEDYRDDIVRLIDRNRLANERSNRFVSAGCKLISDSFRISLEATDSTKIGEYVNRFALREFKQNKRGGKPENLSRFLSGITPDGLMIFENTAKCYCEKLYVIQDDYGASSRVLLSAMRSKANEMGYNTISCYCPTSPFEKMDHLFVPELGIGFMTSNKWHPITLEPCVKINYKRFTDNDYLRKHKQRLSFNYKAAKELINEAVELKSEARDVYLELESFYHKAMDYSKVDLDIKRFIKSAKKRAR